MALLALWTGVAWVAGTLYSGNAAWFPHEGGIWVLILGAVYFAGIALCFGLTTPSDDDYNQPAA